MKAESAETMDDWKNLKWQTCDHWGLVFSLIFTVSSSQGSNSTSSTKLRAKVGTHVQTLWKHCRQKDLLRVSIDWHTESEVNQHIILSQRRSSKYEMIGNAINCYHNISRYRAFRFENTFSRPLQKILCLGHRLPEDCFASSGMWSRAHLSLTCAGQKSE